MNDADIALAYFRAEIEPGLRAVGTPDEGINHLRRHWLDGMLVLDNGMAEIKAWWNRTTGEPQATRHLVTGYRCTCHHPNRLCKFQCSNSTEVVRPSDGRPVCGSCVRCPPKDSEGFHVGEYHWKSETP